MSKNGVYIFDLDGTLVNLPVNWRKLKEEIADKFGIENRLPPLYQILNEYFANRPDQLKIAFDMMDQHELKAVQDAVLIDCALDVLDRVAVNSRLALVTLQGRAACNALLKKFALGRFFEMILTREDSLDRAKQIGIIIEKMSVSARDAVMVGDRDNDVICARQVGLACVLIGTRDSQTAPAFSYPSMKQFLSTL
ncbi:MAG: HAD family hydrolase [Nitrososphaerales archaeon]